MRVGAAIEVDVRPKSVWFAADNGEHQRHVISGRAHDRFRAAADTDPGRETSGLDRRKHPLICQWRPRGALPCHRFLLDQCRKEIELFLKQLFVIAEFESEQRKGFRKGSAAENDLGPAIGHASSVAKRWNTRIGSSELSTVTAEPRRIRLVRVAIAASRTSGADTAKSARWCSPTPKASTPTSSASTPSSTTLRRTCAWGKGWPPGPSV